MKRLICIILIFNSIYFTYGQIIDQTKLFTINQSSYKLEVIDDNMNPLLSSLKCNCYNSIYPSNHMVGLNWNITVPGILNFEIIPNDKNDDIDFILYKYNVTTSLTDEIRCSASGNNVGSNSLINCNDPIGINGDSKYLNSKPGCSEQSGFLAGIETNINEKYLLLVNNISSSNGFQIQFTGDAKIESSLNLNSITDNNINIFPIPVKQNLNLAFTNSTVTNSISIFDTKMLKVLELKNPGDQINVNSLAPGLYYIVLFTENGVMRKSFIKF